ANLDAARAAPLKIDAALITPVPGWTNGCLTAIALFVFAAFFAVGPGVCVWLALSELMPTRIRSNGMSIALVINQAVSTTIAAIFLPTVGKYGYSTMFFAFAGCTVIYFVTATFFLPETKGKTLEEIEEHFEGKKRNKNIFWWQWLLRPFAPLPKPRIRRPSFPRRSKPKRLREISNCVPIRASWPTRNCGRRRNCSPQGCA